MAEGHHDQLSELFERAVELSPEERRHFLEICTDDPAIRSDLRSLLAAHDRAPNLLERLAGDVLPAALQAVADDDRVHGRNGRLAQPIISTPERSTGGAPAAIAAGARMGAYEIQGRIAAGGMGVVYRAFDTVLQRTVAIKTLAWSTPDARASILREARAASALNHPHVCTIYEVGEHDDVPFIAMEYLDGRTLRDLIPPDGLPPESIVRYGVQVAQAVEYAHRHGIIHRDLKSTNVMISSEGHVKVLDFGLASRIPAAEMETVTRMRAAATNEGPLAGTLAYLAPELLRGSPADKRSDVWALGVLLYEVAAGRLPFQGATPFELTAAILNDTRPPLPATLPMPLQSVIGKCLVHDPAQRYRDAGELRVALETVQLGSDRSVTWREESRGAVRPAPRWRRPLLIAAVTVVALAGAAGVMWFNAKRTLALTDRDTLLVADFINTTGDSVFDRTLKQALSIHLGQSPFLSVVSREEERATLRLMTKSPDDRLTGPVAREACQRIGAKAMIEGTIAPVGSHYVIGLDALNCQSGATIGSEQAEAASREQVLTVLGAAASRLRSKLGESLPTVQRFDTPLEQATTSSLEAFQAFSAAEDIRSRTSEFGAVPFYKRAIELDSDFALAYARLSAVYWNVGQAAEGSRNAEEAYARRDRVSERERFYIDAQRCGLRADNRDCRNNVFELWKRTYPRDGRPYGNLSGAYYATGMCDKALENGLEALRLDPGYAQPYAAVARAYLCLEKPAQAQRALEQAVSRHLENPWIYIVLFRSAFYQRDDRAIQRVREWASGQPEEPLFKEFESDAAAFDGRMRRSREFRLDAERLASVQLKESVLPIRARGAIYEAAQGDFQRTRDTVKSISAESPPPSVTTLLVTATLLSRDYDEADVLLQARSDALDQGPAALLDGVVRVLRKVAAGDRSAIAALPPANPGELVPAQSFRPVYVRGLAYLQAGDGAKAAAEFQRILDHRGLEPISPLYPLAYVQQARAYVLAGEHIKARNAYQNFLTLWKDADPDVPILREAQAEYARLLDSPEIRRQR